MLPNSMCAYNLIRNCWLHLVRPWPQPSVSINGQHWFITVQPTPNVSIYPFTSIDANINADADVDADTQCGQGLRADFSVTAIAVSKSQSPSHTEWYLHKVSPLGLLAPVHRKCTVSAVLNPDVSHIWQTTSLRCSLWPDITSQSVNSIDGMSH